MSGSLQLYHFRTDEDDDGGEVDPGEQSRREGDRSVRGEDTETAREEPERQLCDLPQHGRYQRRKPRGLRLHPRARNEAVDGIEEDEARGEPQEWRHDRQEDPHRPAEPGGDERALGSEHAVGDRERRDRECADAGDEGEGFSLSAYES